VAARALELLLAQLTAQARPTAPVMLAPRLIERRSVAAPPG
jgi:DNA-binding LacI/PurR family transcriptional regulator